LKRAVAVLDRTVASGQGALLVVSGGAGIGKSALMSEICRGAVHRGYGVGVGKAEESDQIASMAPLLLALRSGREPLLSQPAFISLAPMERQQLWLIDRLVDDLETRAMTGPVLVCIDDFQWADTSTALALRVLPGRLGGSPIVWMITTRPGAGAAENLIQAASRDVPVDTIALTPLRAAAIAQIAQDYLGEPVDDDVIALLGGADGLPFLAVALLEGLAAELPTERRGKSPTGAVGEDLPDALVLGVRTRVEAMPAKSVQVVRIGAVLGRTFAVADAAVLLGGSSTDTVLPWVKPAVRAGVLDDDGVQLAFRHDLLRQAVYARHLNFYETRDNLCRACCAHCGVAPATSRRLLGRHAIGHRPWLLQLSTDGWFLSDLSRRSSSTLSLTAKTFVLQYISTNVLGG
jgi:predicted ATPase